MTQDEEGFLRGIIKRALRGRVMTQSELPFVERLQEKFPDRYREILREEEAEFAEERRVRDFF